jgi:hypothetical protein
MTPKEKESFCPSFPPAQIFAVWVDEGGQPRFPKGPEMGVPPEYFVHVDGSRGLCNGDFVLVSGPEEMFFARVGQTNGCLHRVDSGAIVLRDGSFLVLGVVVSGFEWFTILYN